LSIFAILIEMKIIFAQGNPGTQYEKTRHNIGFIMLDRLADQLKVDFITKTKFHATVAETTLKGEKLLLVKPTTFYNDTGIAARAICDFYKLNPATDFLVIHDDLALPFGTIRTREKGRDAGNNGIKSLNAHIRENYKRIRLGIYNEQRDKINDVNFVLGVFSQSEFGQLDPLFHETKKFIDAFTNDSFVSTKVVVPTPQEA